MPSRGLNSYREICLQRLQVNYFHLEVMGKAKKGIFGFYFTESLSSENAKWMPRNSQTIKGTLHTEMPGHSKPLRLAVQRIWGKTVMEIK